MGQEVEVEGEEEAEVLVGARRLVVSIITTSSSSSSVLSPSYIGSHPPPHASPSQNKSHPPLQKQHPRALAPHSTPVLPPLIYSATTPGP
jgi:hypothetical protein